MKIDGPKGFQRMYPSGVLVELFYLCENFVVVGCPLRAGCVYGTSLTTLCTAQKRPSVGHGNDCAMMVIRYVGSKNGSAAAIASRSALVSLGPDPVR